MPTTKEQIRANLSMPRTTGKMLKSVADARSVGKAVAASSGKAVAASSGKAVVASSGKAASAGKAREGERVQNAIAKTKPTKREQYRKWERSVLALSDVDPAKMFPFAVLHRKVKDCLKGTQVDHVSSETTVVIREALMSYLFKMYENGFNASVKSGKRTTLMVRDLHAVYQAMGDAIVEPKREPQAAAGATTDDA